MAETITLRIINDRRGPAGSDAEVTNANVVAAIGEDAAEAKTALSLSKSDVGLGNADNTSDADKPISTAAAAALALRVRVDAAQGLSATQQTQGRRNIDATGRSTMFAASAVVEVPDDTARLTAATYTALGITPAVGMLVRIEGESAKTLWKYMGGGVTNVSNWTELSDGADPARHVDTSSDMDGGGVASVAGVQEVVLWNSTQSKYQILRLSGSAGSETVEISDLP